MVWKRSDQKNSKRGLPTVDTRPTFCWTPTSAGRRRRRRGGVQRTASINNCLTRYSIQYRQLLKQREFHSHSLTSEVSSCFYLRAQRGRAFQTPHKALRLLMLLKRVSQRATERFMIQGLRSFNILKNVCLLKSNVSHTWNLIHKRSGSFGT